MVFLRVIHIHIPLKEKTPVYAIIYYWNWTVDSTQWYVIHIYNDVCIYNVESQQEYPVISTTISKYVCASSARFFTCSVNHYSERSINKELIDLSYWLTRVWVMHSEREIQPEWAYGWAWAASDQPLWHPKMASLVNPYWAVMALALLTEKKLRHVRNPSHSSHSNQRIKFRTGYPISTYPARRPEQHLFHPVVMATNLAGLGPTGSTRPSTYLSLTGYPLTKKICRHGWISISFKMENYV